MIRLEKVKEVARYMIKGSLQQDSKHFQRAGKLLSSILKVNLGETNSNNIYSILK